MHTEIILQSMEESVAIDINSHNKLLKIIIIIFRKFYLLI